MFFKQLLMDPFQVSQQSSSSPSVPYTSNAIDALDTPNTPSTLFLDRLQSSPARLSRGAQFRKFLFKCATASAASLLLLASSSAHAISCRAIFDELASARVLVDTDGKKSPQIVKSYDSDAAIRHTLEAEGLFYEDIAKWFPKLKDDVGVRLEERLQKETKGKAPKFLTKFLKDYITVHRKKNIKHLVSPTEWAEMSPKEQLRWLLEQPNFFDTIKMSSKSEMFENSILTFDELDLNVPSAPAKIGVGDDLGSWELRSKGAIEDRTEYQELRQKVEQFLESSIGHQHLFHEWPRSDENRKNISGQYIELLDSTTWFLFWRQVKRDPEIVSGILDHPYLGVYDRPSLERLNTAMQAGNKKAFNNKFRMVGARSFKPLGTPDKTQVDPSLYSVSWELRSGNKGDKREFVEDMVEARLASGDYKGLQTFNAYDFNASTSLEDLNDAKSWWTSEELAILKKFEVKFSYMSFNPHRRSYNHYRNKLIAPLLPWEARLSIEHKMEDYLSSQKVFARKILSIAKKFLKDLKDAEDPAEFKEDTLEKIKQAVFLFSSAVRLDLDFERYLQPVPSEVPSMLVPSSGAIDVNKIDLGLELSFRFPSEKPITSKIIAEQEITRMVQNLQKTMGPGQIEKIDSSGHGHNASIKYKYTDSQGRTWRVEWDGIQRYYIQGRLVRPHGGIIEVPTAKFAPQTPEEIIKIFDAGRMGGLRPKRVAGGGHVNVDLEMLYKMPTEIGTRKILNLIGYYESIREMVTFIWQHPYRSNAALPFEPQAGFSERLLKFKGDWYDLAKFLYDEGYFNHYITRKPRYMELNVTAVMADAVPEEYRKGTLDIKNPTMKWFPDFGTTRGRMEFRLFDAPLDEYDTALLVKYIRALLNKAYNTPFKIGVNKKYSQQSVASWIENPAEFQKAMEAHFAELGLDWREYRGVVGQALKNRQELTPRLKELERFQDFKPAQPRPVVATKQAG